MKIWDPKVNQEVTTWQNMDKIQFVLYQVGIFIHQKELVGQCSVILRTWGPKVKGQVHHMTKCGQNISFWSVTLFICTRCQVLSMEKIYGAVWAGHIESTCRWRHPIEFYLVFIWKYSPFIILAKLTYFRFVHTNMDAQPEGYHALMNHPILQKWVFWTKVHMLHSNLNVEKMLYQKCQGPRVPWCMKHWLA